MEKARVTPKDFFLWVGAIISLYWSIVAFIFLLFNYITYAFPDPLAYPSDPYSGGIPFQMSSIIVLFPIYIALMWIIRRDIAHDQTRIDVWVRRWAIIFTLFIAGLTVVIDLVTVLSAFFRGEELTESFILKVLIVLAVAAIVFMHFIADLWGYWQQFPSRNLAVMYGVCALAVVSVVSGFFIIGTPQQARDYQFDEQKVSDLQSIQSQVITYWQEKQMLPTSLSQLDNSISDFAVPTDPQTGAQYEYDAVASTTFKLCANFNAPTQFDYSDANEYATPEPAGAVGDLSNDTWYHGAGESCFVRTIDPSTYPALKTTNL